MGIVNRKLIAIFITAILLITSIALFVIFSTAPPTAPPVSVSQKKGLVFIENVLPLDISQYNVSARAIGKLYDLTQRLKRTPQPANILNRLLAFNCLFVARVTNYCYSEQVA